MSTFADLEEIPPVKGKNSIIYGLEKIGFLDISSGKKRVYKKSEGGITITVIFYLKSVTFLVVSPDYDVHNILSFTYEELIKETQPIPIDIYELFNKEVNNSHAVRVN